MINSTSKHTLIDAEQTSQDSANQGFSPILGSKRCASSVFPASTPEKVAKFEQLIKEQNLHKPPTPNTRAILTPNTVGKVVSVIAQKENSTPGTTAKELHNSIYERINTASGSKPETALAISLHQPWIATAAEALADVMGTEKSRSCPTFVDIKHLENQGKAGFHICDEYNPKWMEMNGIVKSPEGPVYARWNTSHGTKGSTFYPPELSKADILTAIRNSRPLPNYTPYADPNVCLTQIPLPEGNIIYGEKSFSSKNPMVSPTFYPVMRFLNVKDLPENTPVLVTIHHKLGKTPSTELSVNSNEIIQAGQLSVQEDLLAKKTVRYINKENETVVVDIAKQLPTKTSVPLGFLLEMPASKEIIDHLEMQKLSTTTLTQPQTAIKNRAQHSTILPPSVSAALSPSDDLYSRMGPMIETPVQSPKSTKFPNPKSLQSPIAYFDSLNDS